MHSIEQQQEERAKLNAEAKADLKKKKDEADILAVRAFLIFVISIILIFYVMILIGTAKY
jgi:hypothetical protein